MRDVPMKKATITLTANAGVIIEAGDKTVLIDALHRDTEGVYGGLSKEQIESLWERFSLRGPDLYITTHTHPDHYSPQLHREAEERWKNCVFLNPSETGVLSYEGGGISAHGVRTPHDGAALRQEANFAFFLRIAELSVLAPGDCSLKNPEYLINLIGNESCDIVLLNFPWICLKRARNMVRDALKARHIMVVHLPPKERDTYGYQQAALAAKEKMAGESIHILETPFQSVLVSY